MKSFRGDDLDWCPNESSISISDVAAVDVDRCEKNFEELFSVVPVVLVTRVDARLFVDWFRFGLPFTLPLPVKSLVIARPDTEFERPELKKFREITSRLKRPRALGVGVVGREMRPPELNLKSL